jgi:hypothetical protein
LRRWALSFWPIETGFDRQGRNGAGMGQDPGEDPQDQGDPKYTEHGDG